MITVGKYIENKRKTLGLTKSEMSTKLGISSQLLGQYEMEKHNPNF